MLVANLFLDQTPMWSAILVWSYIRDWKVGSSANLQWFPKFDALLFGRFASPLVFCLADI